MWTFDLLDSSSGLRSPAVQLDGNSVVFHLREIPYHSRKRRHDRTLGKKIFK